MRFRPLRGSTWAAGFLALVVGSTLPGLSQPIDPAVVGERIVRLTATVESLESALASQKRQIDTLANEVQRLREDALERAGHRPWADDLKKLADAITEVDRKRAADSEQVVRVLGELRKAVAESASAAAAAAAAAKEPRVSPRAERESRGSTKPAVPKDTGGTSSSTTEGAGGETMAVPYTLERGQSLSEVVNSFNEQAKTQGYKPLTVDQVMKFNKITDARRVPAGATIRLPLIPK